jgi:hypothetical protein
MRGELTAEPMPATTMTVDQWFARLLELAEALLATPDATNDDRERALEVIGCILGNATESDRHWASIDLPPWYEPPIFGDGADEDETPELQIFRRALREHLVMLRAVYPHLTSQEGRA